ncbi:hypothetical protein Tco_0452107 [Tanacetum coccineum]
MTSQAQQITLDNELVAPENRRAIGKCNMRINPGMKPKEPTYQVALDALALTLTTCYPAFLITTEVPVIYMHQFWATVSKHKASYRFKIDNKKFFVNVEVFREILNICPKVPSKEFDEPPTEEEALSFIRELGHSGEIRYITDVVVDHLHQPWRTFASIINKCLCRKVSGLDKIRLFRVQILWGMYYKKNLDFVALIWEDLAYQIDNIDSKKQDKMFYPRFTKIIIHHFLTKDKSISWRNKMFMHTARDDSVLGTMRFVSKHANTQVYGAILPKAMTNQALLDSVAYKTYHAIASGAEPPMPRKAQKKSDLAISSEESPSKKKSAKAKKVTATKPKPSKKKAPVKADRGKSLNVLSEVALSEAAQLKESTNKGRKTFISHKQVAQVMELILNQGFLMSNISRRLGDSREEDEDDENDSEDNSDDGDDDDGNDVMSTYEAAALLSEFELTKILLDKIEESKSHLRADYKKKLYDALVESYNTNKDLFNTYGEVFTLKRIQDDSDKDRDPSAGSKRGTKRRKSRKEVESSKDSRSKEKKSSRTSKDASQSQHKSSGKSAHTEEPSHTVDDSGVQQDQEFDTGNNDEQPANKEVSKDDCQVARAKEPRSSFDELIDTSFDFSAFVLNWLNIKDLTQEILVGPAFELLKGTCRERIIAVTRLTIMKKYDYGHLEEIEVRREDQKLYKFREGPIHAYSDPKGVIYKDQMNRNRLMRADELHKFSDGTLDDVRSALNDITKGIRMEYLPKRK